MLKAAMSIMKRKGLTNFKMEEVAAEAKVTKVTLYTYFASKENLIMAVSHNICLRIHGLFEQVIQDSGSDNGLDTCMKIKGSLLDFVAEEPFRSNMIMEVISVFNMPEAKLSNAMASSTFRQLLNTKLEELSSMVYDTIEKGREDGSIANDAPNHMLLIYLWNCISGFITITSTPGFQHEGAKELLQEMNVFHDKIARSVISNK